MVITTPLQALAKHISLYSGDDTQLKQVDKDYIKGFISYLKTAKNFIIKEQEQIEIRR